MILSYKAVGTFDRISAVLLTLDVVLRICCLSSIEFFLFEIDFVFVIGLDGIDVNEDFDLVVLPTIEKDRVKFLD